MTDHSDVHSPPQPAPEVRSYAAAVRARPEMWFGGTDADALHEMACEVVAHVVDLALDGKVTRLDITVDGASFTLVDDGPGMPTQPVNGLPLMTAVFVRPGMSSVYDGHGIHSHLTANSQIAAVSAACDAIHVCTYRPDGVYEQDFEAGEAVSPLGWRGRMEHEQDSVGSVMRFTPSREIFGDSRIDVPALYATLRDVLAFVPTFAITINGCAVEPATPAELVGGGTAQSAEHCDGDDLVVVNVVSGAPAGARHRAYLNFRELTGDPAMVDHCVNEALEHAYAGKVPEDVTVVVHALFLVPEFTGPDMRVCGSPKLKDMVEKAVLTAVTHS